MMIRIVLILMAANLIISCNKKQDIQVQQADVNKVKLDTLIGSKVITNELAGSVFRKRAKSYFLSTANDTSDFICYLTEAKDDGKVSIDLYFEKTMSYRQQIDQLKKLLAEAAKDFDFDSLSTIFIGRLVNTGDLAIAITNQVNAEQAAIREFHDYDKVEAILLKSKLTSDFNRLLQPYNRSVAGFSVEKVFFTDKKELFLASKIESDSTAIPDRILDCITWILIK
jgi:hypothetical protein